MDPRWTAVGALSQAALAAIFASRYLAGESTLLAALVGTAAALCASVFFGLEYRNRRNAESTGKSVS